MATTVTTRLEDKLVKKIDFAAYQESVDRSALIRKLLVKAVREWMIEKSLQDYEDGKITLWCAAKKSGISLWEMVDEVKRKRVCVPYGLEELEEDLKGIL